MRRLSAFLAILLLAGCQESAPIYRWPGAVQAVLQVGENKYQPLPNLPLKIAEGDPEVSQDIVTNEEGLAIYYLIGLGTGSDSILSPDYYLVYEQDGAEIRFPGKVYGIMPFLFEMREGQMKAVGIMEVPIK